MMAQTFGSSSGPLYFNKHNAHTQAHNTHECAHPHTRAHTKISAESAGINGSSAEAGEQGSSSGASALSNPTAMNNWEVAPSDGHVNGEVPFTMKRRKHISNERQRRVHMNTLLESLQALLPDPNPRKDRCSLLTDVIDYLQSLEDKTQELATEKEMIMNSIAQAKKKKKPSKVSTLAMSSHLVCLQNVHVQVFKSLKPITNLEEIVITFTSSRSRGILSQILMLLSINQMKIINATFSTTMEDQMLHYIHAQVPKDLNLQSDDLNALFSSPSQLDVDEEHIT